MPKAVGIDLGTTTPCRRPGGRDPVVIPNAEGSHTHALGVAFRQNGEVPRRADRKNQAITNPDRTIGR